MKKLSRIPSLKYTMYSLFCLFLSVGIAASAGFVYVVKNDLYSVSEDILSGFDLFAVNMRYAFGIIAVSCAAMCILIISFTMLGAGCSTKSDVAERRPVDKLPLEIYYGVLCTAIFFAAKLCEYVMHKFGLWNLFIVCPMLLIISLMTEEIFYSGAIRFKTDTLISNTLVYRICKLFHDAYVNFALLWKILFFVSGYFAVTYLCLHFYTELLFAVWIIISFVYLTLIGSCVIFLNSIRKGTERISKGNLNYRIDTTGMYSEFRYISNNLNHISDGLSKALEEKTKSERLRTELITNVSHDIKTPLTSVINYVDLLKKENLTQEERNQYLDVLDRQSAKLKKLIIDLVEASKALTGNVSVELSPLNLNELLNQAIGEYSDRFIESGLETVISINDEVLTVNGDGRHIWRIFDNLMSNICKYALSGTRVYIESKKENGFVYVEMKNISKSVLNISPDELAERFVRGDSSRTTEGSGLGLSIASSLAELQHAELVISIDGDLFKTKLIFEEMPS